MAGFVIIVVVVCITIYAIYDSKHTSEVEQTFWSNDKEGNSSRLKKVNDRVSSLVKRVGHLENEIKILKDNERANRV